VHKILPLVECSFTVADLKSFIAASTTDNNMPLLIKANWQLWCYQKLSHLTSFKTAQMQQLWTLF